VLSHVAHCVRCQALVTELTEVADALPLAVPEAEPSAGFGARVVAAMQAGRGRRRRRRALVLAATAAAAAIVSVTLVQVIDAGRELPQQASAPTLRSVAMRGENGNSVGRVAISGTDPASLLVNVDYAVPDGSYDLQLRRSDAASTWIGTMTVRDGRGTWKGKVPIRAGENLLAMVNEHEHTVCDAVLTLASPTGGVD
jgi:hypothetical protein